MEEKDKTVFIGEFIENRGDEVNLEIPSDKKVVNSTSELKWISVCNNDTSDLLASLDFKKETSGTISIVWPVVIGSTASFLILILMIILIIVMMRRKENDTEKRINENELNENKTRSGQ